MNLSQEVKKVLSDMKTEGSTLHHLRILQRLKFNLILTKENFKPEFKKVLNKTSSYFNELKETLNDEKQLLTFLMKEGYSFSPNSYFLDKAEFYVKALIKFNMQQEELQLKGSNDELQKLIVKEIQYTDYLLHVLDYYNGNLSKKLKIIETKVTIDGIPAVLTVRECYEIYQGIKPLFFYHGTKLEQLKRIMGNKQLSPQKHFDKRFNEEMELYNKVKSVFVFIREIKDVLSKDVDVKHIRQMVKDLKRNKFISIKIKDIEKENNKERMKAKLGLILEELNFLKKELIGKESDFYSVFKIRDPHFMFFGAEYPYACQENFQSCINYAGIKGAVIELYPQLYTKLDLDLMRPNSEKIIGLAVGTYREHAQVHGFLGHDLATRKKINVKLIRKIYTNNLAEVQPLVSKSGINIPILSFNNHREEFRKVMGEIEMVLKKNGLIS